MGEALLLPLVFVCPGELAEPLREALGCWLAQGHSTVSEVVPVVFLVGLELGLEFSALLSRAVGLSLFQGQLPLHKHLEVRAPEQRCLARAKGKRGASCQSQASVTVSSPSTCPLHPTAAAGGRRGERSLEPEEVGFGSNRA